MSTTVLSFELLATWREEAWRRAEALLAADTAEEYAAVAASIEQNAAATAQVLKTESLYLPLSNGAAVRNAFCAANFGSWNAPPPW